MISNVSKPVKSTWQALIFDQKIIFFASAFLIYAVTTFYVFTVGVGEAHVVIYIQNIK
jgi:hypothetical protein